MNDVEGHILCNPNNIINNDIKMHCKSRIDTKIWIPFI